MLSRRKDCDQIVYLACPMGAVGGGMYRVVDYLIQTSTAAPIGYKLTALDTRGPGSSLMSLAYTFVAVARITHAALTRRLAGVHIHMAERLSVYRKGALLITCRVLGVPVILHLHAAQFPIFYSKQSCVGRKIVRLFFRIPNHVVVLGSTAQNFVKREIGLAPEKVSVVVNGVPEPLFPRRQRCGDQPFRILFLGNLTERKGVSDLLNAVASLRKESNWELTCAGGGDVKRYVRLAEQLGLSQRVSFPGWQSQENASKLVAEADVLVLPSYDEGLPLVILEALANGVAVVCTPVGEIPNFLSDKEVLMTPPGEPALLGRAIQAVMDDEQLRRRLEKCGRDLYEGEFSVTKAYAAVCALYAAHFR